MAGRRPKPTVLHKLQGTYNVTDHRRRQYEAIAEDELGKAPAELTPTQAAAWRYAVAHAPKGVLHAIDRDVLRWWVETLDRRNEAQQLLEAEDSAVLWIASPCHRIIDRTTTLLIRLTGELGFSPAARPRIHADPPAASEGDPWTGDLRLITGGRGASE